ncbi:MAG: glycosyltransferase [Anaerolineae bacterium]|jgi:glycosyltransferase involved in cell wall biosynthesis
MKVCVVTTAFPRWPGDGQAVFVWEAVRAIARQGIQVRVVAMHSPESRVHETMDGVEVLRPRYWWPERWEYLRKEGPAGLPVAWRKYPLARVQILPFLLVHALTAARCARSCDLIHAQWTLSAGAAQLGRWLHQRPILVTVQGSDIFQVTRHPLGAWLTQKVLLQCDGITALSQALKDATTALGIREDRIEIIPNGVDTDEFTPPADDIREDVILYVGTLIKRKGLKYLLGAMPEIMRSHPGFRLVLVGEGPEEQALRQLADEVDVAKRVSFLGFQPPDQVRAWMQRARVLVLPSLEEGMGVVLLEALACGTPVVGSRVDGIQDVITPQVGRLVPPADSAALSEAIQAILSDSQQWADMSQQGRHRAVTHYDWDHIATQFVNLYESIA